MLADSAGNREFSLFYLGLSRMGLNRTDDAILSFEELLESGSGELIHDAGWYLALCYMKQDMPDKTRDLLEEISVSDSPYKKDARRILRSIR